MIDSIVLTSCSVGNAEADGQRYCDLLCESKELMFRAINGYQSVMSEATALS